MRILIFCQAYPPDPAATGQYIAEVARELAGRGHRVEVLTASRGYADGSRKYRRREVDQGVHVRRFRWTSFGKRSNILRIAGMGMFTMRCIWAAIMSRGVSVILATTSPPMGGFAAAVARVVRATPFAYWSLDVHPDEILIYIGATLKPKPGLLARAMNRVEASVLKRASTTITADQQMAATLRKKCNVSSSLTIAPLWSHDDVLKSCTTSETHFRRTHGLLGKFVVMYSGNQGVAAPLEGLVDAAILLRDHDHIRFVFIGNGVRHPQLRKRVEASGASNILMFTFQPRDQLSDVLCAADVHAVAIHNDFVGVQHPCKAYNALAVGRPLLLLGPEHSPWKEWVDHGAAWRQDSGCARDIADCVLRLASDPARVAHASETARELARAQYAQREGRARIADAVLACSPHS